MEKKNSLEQYLENHGGATNTGNLRIDPLNRKDVTYYPDGSVATVMTWKYGGERVITQYDKNGLVTVSQDLGKDDTVNFQGGLISSIVRYVKEYRQSEERIETQYGEDGHILSSTNQTKIRAIGKPGQDKWLTTQHSTYYGNGRLATVTTYQQRTKRKTRDVNDEWSAWAHMDDLIFGGGEDSAESYVSSITQYDESGKLLVTFNFHEFDEVSYHPSGRVANILRTDENGNPKTMTSYDENGKILNTMVYKDGVVISSTDYTNGHPTSNAQQGNAEYQNIFESAKNKVAEKNVENTKNKTVAQKKVSER